jgi:hypothetical protein
MNMMNNIYDILFILIVIILWLLGGQINKSYRRVALPIICALNGHLNANKRHPVNRGLAVVVLLLAIPLSIGYGETSMIRKWLGGSDNITRLLISIFIIIVINIVLMITGFTWFKLTQIVWLNILAWQIKAGSLGKIGSYDILLEDIYRSTALATSLLLIYN